jgi:hypothetical protein
VPSDEKKPDPNQEQEFEKWDREHREPTGPIISPDAEEILRNEMRFDRIAREALKAFYDKHRQEAFAEKRAAINAELDAEFGARDRREKDAATTPQRSLEPDPKPAEIKPRAAVVEIKKAATTPKDPAPDPMQLSKADDEDGAVEERRGLWSKAEKGIDLTNAHTRKLYQIGKTELNERLNAGDLTRAKRGYVTAASIKAHPPGFVDRKAR